MRLTRQQQEMVKELADKVEERYQTESDVRMGSYPEEIQECLKIKTEYRGTDELDTALGKRLSDYLGQPDAIPSDFFKSVMPDMEGWIPDYLLDDFYCSVDAVNKWQIDRSLFRRSSRTKRYRVYIPHMFSILHEYHKMGMYGTDIVSLLQGTASEEIVQIYRYYQSGICKFGMSRYWIQAELDRGNTALVTILKDILLEENAANLLSNEMISGIVQSECHELYEALGQLLLTARLQEGLRQVICQNMDSGTLDAFLYLFDIVVREDLLRYSSVLRTVGTWTGLLGEEEGKLERIGKKQIALIAQYLSNEDARTKALQSEDSMQIYLALWSYGVQEIGTACEVMEELIMKGTGHQRLVGCYYMNVMRFNRTYVHQITKQVVRHFHHETDTMAVVIHGFMPEYMSYADKIAMRKELRENDYNSEGMERHYAQVEEYFADGKECQEFYNILWEMLGLVLKKSIDICPCVFPWNKASLQRTDIICRLAIIASALRDEEKITQIAKLLPKISADSYNRTSVMLLTLVPPYDAAQRELLIGCVGDRSDTGFIAGKIASHMELLQKDYLQLEEMLKYKNGEIRKTVLSILYQMPDEPLYDCINRLLSDKKEEKRTAGLDLLLRLQNDLARQVLFEKSVLLLELLKSPTTKEEIMIRQLQKVVVTGDTKENGYGLYDINAEYVPEFDEEFLEECNALYKDLFADETRLNGVPEILTKLDALIEEHKYDEFETEWGAVYILTDSIRGLCSDYRKTIPMEELWEDFYQREIGDCETCLLLYLYICVLKGDEPHFEEYGEPFVEELYGKIFLQPLSMVWIREAYAVIRALNKKHRDSLLLQKCSVSVANKLLHLEKPLICSWKSGKKKDENGNDRQLKRSILTYAPIQIFTVPLGMSDSQALFDKIFPYQYELASRHGFCLPGDSEKRGYASKSAGSMAFPSMEYYITACVKGMISMDYLYKILFEESGRNDTMRHLSCIVCFYRERNDSIQSRKRHAPWVDRYRRDIVERLLGHPIQETFSQEDEERLQLAMKLYQDFSGLMIEAELTRGDGETEFSRNIYGVGRIFGVSNFVRILCALGTEALERSSYFDSFWSTEEGVTKKRSLCHMLQVCIPDYHDDAKGLQEHLQGTDIKESRLVEAAFYAPEWIPLVGDYLGWDGFVSGCYYFMAHMKERFDDKRKAMIARYTPIEISDLNDGAFDVNWFKQVYCQLGESHFRMLYDGAKYISDGAKHTRARKYADAALNQYELKDMEREITAKRNKDLVMAYGLVPIQGEKDVQNRYLFLHEFKKESKQYGAQRRASESRAVDLALQNLSVNAGYQDVTRLILQMERLVYEERKGQFEPYQIEDIAVWLSVGENGTCELCCEKSGKRLKTVPAKYKKNEYVVGLNESKKQLTEQYRRTKTMFEDAMEKESPFTFGELKCLIYHPVIAQIVSKLVVRTDYVMGFIRENGLLPVEQGKQVVEISDDTLVRVAHPYHLYRTGNWHAYQQYIFEQQMIQPFKQVFRELYVKTEEESNMFHSLRYAGNQIQPARTVGCLKSRHWVADVEAGLQKVYYKENIVAQIYALADWFSPADIESPTLEWVVFTDRRTGEELRIKEIPDVIFSEVMRDVDMAVSVAHAGGVDPESSHSTIEMRKIIAEFTLKMFKLCNVQFTDHHAIVSGRLANYRIHLGSGVVHQEHGPMIQVLPVHSQRRGRIFLPFVDEDPKTAEIITKILFFAQDEKIKDPLILSQIG